MFELVDNTTARVNGKMVHLAGVDAQGNRLPKAVDASASPHSGYRNVVELRDLRNVCPSQFPSDFYFAIWNVKGEFRRASGVKFERAGDRASIDYYFDFAYEAWEHAINLGEFADNMCSALRDELSIAGEISRSEDQGIIYVTVTVEMPLENDCPSEFGKVAEIYRACLAELRADSYRSALTDLGEPEYKWWLRYVLVPILCSGALAGIVGWYLKAT